MASILRSGKFLRYFAGFTRNVVVNTVRDNESSSLLQTTTCMCTQFQHGFANAAAATPDVSLDKQLRRLDQDVRRIGRISRRDIEDVLEEIRVQRSATSSQSLLVIRCCGNLVPEEMPEVRTALVQEIWKTLNTLNVPMDISHYNALLRVYLENEHQFSPTDFLAEIETKSIEPNRVTYQRLITRYCQQGDIEGATRILEFMREKNLPVNENVFNSLILGHSQANDMESAKGILGVMKQAGLEPSADTYTTLLCSYARHGDIDAILKTLEDCEQKEIILLDKDLLDAIYNLAIHGHGDHVAALLEKLRVSTGFNQDAVNIILRLVNKGYEEIGLQILRKMPRGTRADGQLVDVGIFFIKQLVKANRPLEKILSICKTLQDEGLNPRALLIATEAGLSNGIVNNALPLLKEMKNAGLPIRQHYFWPLICSVESNQVIGVLRRMLEEFSMSPNGETIREYVIPNLKEKNSDKIVQLLRDAGVASGTAAASAAYVALTTNQITEAAKIMESYKAFYGLQLFRQPLIQAYAKTENTAAFIRIVRQMYESGQNRPNNAAATSEQTKSEEIEHEAVAIEAEAEAAAANESVSTESVSVTDSGVPDIVGAIVYDVCVYFRTNRIDIMEKILPALIEQGLSISSNNATRISERIGADMTPKISELLGKLSSGELEPVALKNVEGRKRGLDTLTIDELERFIANVEAKDENSNNIKRHLLSACFRAKNLTKTLQVIERLEGEKFIISPSVWAQLIDLYAYHKQVSDALAVYDKIKAKEPDFQIDNLKTIHVVDLLMQEERIEDAFKFLESNKKSEVIENENSFNYVTSVWRVLNALAEAGDVQKVQRLFDALIEGNYVQPTNVILGPLIKVHLVKDDLPKAVDTFEQICEKYKSTPWKNELACRLIQTEDAANLQKLTDLSTNIHGEVNSLYDLVFSFVECGRIRQARKILETPGLRSRPQRIDHACERYKNEGMVQSLEGLVEATKDLNHIDRNKIYYNLLLSYYKSEDAEKALGLWTKMQEDNIAPTDAFLTKLADLLRKQNMEIPFVLPQALQDPIPKQSPTAPSAAKTMKTANVDAVKQASTLSLFRKAILAGNVDAAINHKSQLTSSETPSIIDISHLIEHLVRAQRLTEATKYVNELLAEKHYPLPKIFRYYLNKVAAAGDIETLTNAGAQLTDEQKKMFSYDNRLCHANIVAGKAEEYIKKLSDSIAAVKTAEEAAKLGEQFPRGGAMGILQQHPELVPQYEAISERYVEFNIYGPINVLWMHLISQGDEQAAKVIWDKHLSNAPRLMFQRVLQTAREQKNIQLAEKVIAQLRDSKISVGAIGNAYSCLMDIHIGNNEFDACLETLKTALKDVSLESINRTALQRLKSGLEEQKKEFPYSIPERKSKDTSSSSSSDDDVGPKRPETRPPRPSA